MTKVLPRSPFRFPLLPALLLVTLLLPFALLAQEPAEPPPAPSPAAWAEAPQGAASAMPQTSETDAAMATATAKGKPGEVAIAPVPFSDPTIGVGIALGAGYIFQLERDQPAVPPSIVGLGGMYSENGTWALALGGKFHLSGDKYRVTAGLAQGSLVYDFYGIGSDAGDQGHSIEITQDGTVAFVQGLRRITPELYAGLRYLRAHSTTSIAPPGDNLPPGFELPPMAVDGVNAALGLQLEYDSRGNEFYPTDGTFAKAGVDFFDNSFGGGRKYQVYNCSYNRFLPLDESKVLALRAFTRFTGGEPPFYALSMFGIHSDLRGFQVGQYRDRHMMSVQAECRAKITRKIGAVAYIGAGGVAPVVDELGFDLFGYGVGLRYRLLDAQPINYRLDWAVAEGESSIIFAVGEAF
jgi:hypothetical protein